MNSLILQSLKASFEKTNRWKIFQYQQLKLWAISFLKNNNLLKISKYNSLEKYLLSRKLIYFCLHLLVTSIKLPKIYLSR